VTVDEAKAIVGRLDPDYASQILSARLAPDVEEHVWVGAAERLQETQHDH
jgi:hypothetical protein